MTAPRTCLVPDLGDDFAQMLTRAEELFIGLDAIADEGAELPTPATLVARVGRQGRPWAAASSAAATLRDAIASTRAHLPVRPGCTPRADSMSIGR